MGTAWFALCPAGWACWSARLYDALEHGTIPVLLADGMARPFDELLDWGRFSLALTTDPREGARTALELASLPGRMGSAHARGMLAQVRAVRRWFELGPGSGERWAGNAVGLLLVELSRRIQN